LPKEFTECIDSIWGSEDLREGQFRVCLSEDITVTLISLTVDDYVFSCFKGFAIAGADGWFTRNKLSPEFTCVCMPCSALHNPAKNLTLVVEFLETKSCF
jgi:hypothetical protein